MPVAVISDAHLGGPGGNGEDLAQQLTALADSDCERVVFLGDLFHVWIGDARFETPEIQRLMPVLRRLRDAGLPLHYIEGNRDFFLAQSPYRRFFTTVGSELAFESGGRRYLVLHGDGLNDRDWQYSMWRRLSKSPPVRFLVCNLPRRWAHASMMRTERRLASTNFRHRIEIPERTIRRFAARRLAEGHDVMLLGHFHEERHWHLEGGGEVRILESWFSRPEVRWL